MTNLQTIRNIGVFFLITACLTGCGSKSNNHISSSAIKEQEDQEKKILEDLKSLCQDEKADLFTQYLAADILVPSNTPTYVIREKLENKIKEIVELERTIKSGTALDDLFKAGKETEGTKKLLELEKATKKKYELILGINNPS